MATTLLVTLQGPEEGAAVRGADVEVLAEYPDSMLVRATEDQALQLAERGIEATPLPDQRVQITGSSFDFDDAVRAQRSVAVEAPPGRTAYYLVKMAGPPAPEWLDALRGLGAEVHSSLPGFTLLVGMLPERVDEVRQAPWVAEVTPYRPAMKVSAKLQPHRSRNLDVNDLSELDADDGGDARLVEVSVFPGESVNDVAALVRQAGGTVLATRPNSIVGTARSSTIAELAQRQGIQAILPHSLPELHNDRATTVMGVPTDHVFAGVALTGAQQIVAVADSGLDTGDPDTLHPDIRTRVVGVTSWPTRAAFAQFVNDPPANDDGPADRNSGHGTHVTGSVLGDGTAALTTGELHPVPAGTAPEARVFFQAIEQRVDWKTAGQLAAAGVEPFTPDWPPRAASLYGIPDDLNDLFQQAYTAGARIHTNSWGAPVAGEYNANSRAVDEFAWNHPDMLILFSAGNEGTDDDGDGVIDPDSIGAPGTAKNCLTVGASENDRPADSDPPPGRDQNWNEWGSPLRWPKLAAAGHVSDDVDGMAAFSSRGPTDDGRIKPDVVAPGTNVLSTLSSRIPANQVPLWGRLPVGHPLRDAYCWSGGTSMSTPLVAGAVALVRQHLVEQRGHVEANRKPSGALLKAVLINGAVAMAGQFPGEIPGPASDPGANPVCGFGRIDVTGAIAPEPRRRMLFADEPDHGVSTGQMHLYRVLDVDPAAPLKVTLVWTDAPGSQLQNRLYLQVQAPDGAVVDGDVAPFPTVTNNVQQVVIASPRRGEYRVRVRGVTVLAQSPGASPGPNPRQDFAVAVSNGADLA